MSEPVLKPLEAGLLTVVIGTLALMGVPGLTHDLAPRGGITGTVRADSGAPLPDVELALFDDTRPGLVEIVHSDSHGRYAFRSVPGRFHVFASPPAQTDWIGAWALDRGRRNRVGLDLTLERGTRVVIAVTGPDGAQLPNAEVRVFDGGRGDVAVARALTDAEGACLVHLPLRSLLAVLWNGDLDPVWFLDGEFQVSSGRLHLQLPASRTE